MRRFTYSTETPKRTPLEGDNEGLIVERIWLPTDHLPLGYDARNPNHGWRVTNGGLAGNEWVRVVAAYEVEEAA